MTKKRLFAWTLTFCLALSLVPGVVFAVDIVDSGYCGGEGDGTNLTWTLDSNGVLTISGNGKMMDLDYDYSNRCPWFNQRDYVNTVIVRNGVTHIGSFAFHYCRYLTNVSLSDSVTSIGDRSFQFCECLPVVSIPASVNSIGDYAFAYCYNLTQANISNGVTTIGQNAFTDCRSLTSVVIPASVTSDYIETLFFGCDSLTSIQVDSRNPTYSSVDGVVFSKDNSIIKVYPRGRDGSYNVPDGVSRIEGFAFDGCKNLKSVNIPDSVTGIGDYAFTGCSSLTEIQVDNRNPTFSSSQGVLFNKDGSKLICYPGGREGEYRIPNNVSTIGDHTFMRCENLTKVLIPSSVTSIGEQAFAGCKNLSSVNIPDGVTTLKNFSFQQCINLTEVIISSNVLSIEDFAFSECSDLYDIFYNGTLAEWNAISIGKDNDPLSSATLHCKDNTPTYTVSYDANGGLGAPALQTKMQGIDLFLSTATPNSPTRTLTFDLNGGTYNGSTEPVKVSFPATFRRWKTEVVNDHWSEYDPGDIYKKDAPLVLYAAWNDNEKIEQYAPKAVREGYELSSQWYRNPECTSWGGYIEEDTTLYAHWNPKSYTVSFDPNGGSVSSTSKEVTYSYSYGSLPEPNWKDHTFDGWYTAKSGGTQVKSDTKVDLTGNQTLYAHWTELPKNDSWQYFSFSNSDEEFFRDSETMDYNAGQYFNHFNDVLAQYYGSASVSYYMDRLSQQQASGWGGSCYGFAAVEGMVNTNLLPVNAIETGKSSMPAVNKPRDVHEVRDMLNYYYLTQFIPALRNEMYDINSADGKQALKKMADEVVGGTPHMFSYFTFFFGHAIILDGGEKLADGSYALVGQDNRFHGYTIGKPDGNNWSDSGEPVTVTIQIPADFSSCKIFLSEDTVLMRDGDVYTLNGDLNENVYSFEPVSNFTCFASADPTGQAVTAQLQAVQEEASLVLYYEPDGNAASDLVLKDRTGNTIYDASNPDGRNSNKVSDFWYTIHGAVATTESVSDGKNVLSFENSPAGLMLSLNEDSEYSVTDVTGGTISMVSPEGYASVDTEKADSVILDVPNSSVIVRGNEGDFSISLDCGNDTVATISGKAETDDVAVTALGDLLMMDAPEGSYSVAFSVIGGKSSTTTVKSNGGGTAIATPTTFVQDSARIVSTEGDANTISVIILCDSGFSGQVILALYDKNDQMLSTEVKPVMAGSNSLTFGAALKDAVTAKIFVLDSQSRPACEAEDFYRPLSLV